MRRALRVGCLAGSLLASSQLAYAQDITVNYSDTYHECLNKASNNQALLRCVEAENSKWGVRLTNAYETLKNSKDFSPETKSRLSDAQKIWVVFQDKACTADGEIDIEDGTGFKLTKASCTLKMTALRATELESLLPSPDATHTTSSPKRE